MVAVRWRAADVRPTESCIRDHIFEYLQARGIFCWRDRQSPRLHRRGTFPEQRGIADILGIYEGLPLAIEVKTQVGHLSADQAHWLERFSAEGGLAIVARSLEDVISALERKRHERVRTTH